MERAYNANTNKTLDERMCGSVEGHVEESVNKVMGNDKFQGPEVPGIKADEALMLIKDRS